MPPKPKIVSNNMFSDVVVFAGDASATHDASSFMLHSSTTDAIAVSRFLAYHNTFYPLSLQDCIVMVRRP